MSVDCDVLVVGAGISGLVTAYRLQQAGRRVSIIESTPRSGGVISTRYCDGALYELGPNSTLDTTPAINALLDDLGIRDQRIDAGAAAKRRFVVRDGELVPLPASPGAFIATRAFSLGAKLRLLREPFIGRADADTEESIASFVHRRIGPEFLDYAVDPFVAGIYAGNPDEISVRAAFPRLHALEQQYGSLIKGQIKGRRARARSAGQAKNTAGSFSFARGMQTLPDAIVSKLHDVHYDTSAVSLERSENGAFTVRTYGEGVERSIRAASVVLSLPAYAAAPVISAMSPNVAAALATIDYAPVLTIASVYRRDDVRHALDGFGFLVPRVEHRRILGSLFSSSMFADRAPEGSVLITTFAGGKRNPGIAALRDDEVSAVVAEELVTLLGAARHPTWQHVTRWPRAIPQYTIGHLQRLDTLDSLERDMPGLFFCASYRGGVSVGDCIASATALADRMVHTPALT